MADQFVTAALQNCISGGIGSLYSTSGVSMQDGLRKQTGAPTIALFNQAGGTSFAQDQMESYGFQVLVDSDTPSGARTAARDIYDHLHETVAAYSGFGDYEVLWLRGIAPPQDLGPGPGEADRFTVSTNYVARLRRPMAVVSAVEPPPPAFETQLSSLQNFYTKGQLQTTSQVPLDFVDNFSIVAWAKPGTANPGSTPDMIFCAAQESNKNVIEFGMITPGSPAGTFIYVRIADDAGNMRQAAYYNAGTSNAWHHYVLQWDGTAGPGYPQMAMKLFVDSVNIPVNTALTVPGDSSTCANSTREIKVGGRYGNAGNTRWQGLIYSAGIYSEVLTQAAIVEMYNGGNGRDFNLEADSGDYQASSSLQDYYRMLGSTDTDFGLDRGADATDRNLESTSPGLSSADLVADVPT
jgi:hypothetical protein